MTKIIGLALGLVMVYSLLSGWLYFREDTIIVEALFNAAMERAIRGEY